MQYKITTMSINVPGKNKDVKLDLISCFRVFHSVSFGHRLFCFLLVYYLALGMTWLKINGFNYHFWEVNDLIVLHWKCHDFCISAPSKRDYSSKRGFKTSISIIVTSRLLISGRKLCCQVEYRESQAAVFS